MNKLESCMIESPFGQVEECAKFVVDDPYDPFVLRNVTSVGQKYVMSLWIKSNQDNADFLLQGSDTGLIHPRPVSREWTKFVDSFVATDTDVNIYFNTQGAEYYIYHPKLEVGIIPTDWSPAAEDFTQQLTDASDAIHETMNEQTASTIKTCADAMAAELESYVDVKNYENFRQVIEAQLSILADEIAMDFKIASDRITEVDGDLRSKFDEVYKHISFSTDGITISSGPNAMSLRVDNEIVMFEKNGTMFGWWDGVDFHTGNIVINVTERAQFGNFAFVPRTDGSLSFLKVAHNTGFYASNRGGILSIYGAYPSLNDTTLIISDIAGELNETTLILGGE